MFADDLVVLGPPVIATIKISEERRSSLSLLISLKRKFAPNLLTAEHP